MMMMVMMTCFLFFHSRDVRDRHAVTSLAVDGAARVARLLKLNIGAVADAEVDGREGHGGVEGPDATGRRRSTSGPGRKKKNSAVPIFRRHPFSVMVFSLLGGVVFSRLSPREKKKISEQRFSILPLYYGIFSLIFSAHLSG